MSHDSFVDESFDTHTNVKREWEVFEGLSAFFVVLYFSGY